ncbi:uncharacterized protein LOC101850997 [Aplysia californica]|uniref:Uncharacterized protein LOC101850997 n=1 Tax=Aplysia californica TaxID=6500 RepID=A0ABM0K7L4_APLCA|nr:uncharacterized protein LOC101850997 [Aplysia californica]
MFHSSHIHMPSRYRQRSALRTFFPSSSFSPPDSREPLRRGILFCSVASILLLVGAILTWLGFNDVFGGKISMTGPLLIALALLMLLLSCKQFMLARKRNRRTGNTAQSEVANGGVTAVVVDHDDGNGAATIVMETWDSVGANNEILRNTDDLAPPSYTDVAQMSCSSNCPSFISHDDRNEAPPSYEETCGGVVSFGSETSLANTISRRCSSQMDTSPIPRRPGHPAKGFFQNDHNFVQNAQQSSDGRVAPRRSSNTLCPSSALTACHHDRNPPLTLIEIKDKAPPLHPPPSSSLSQVLPSTSESLNPETGLQSNGVGSKGGAPASVGSHTEVVDGSVTSPETNAGMTTMTAQTSSTPWSRRSFSSIPSYTCLLSESGEVCAQVYNTSSIIEEMMPTLTNTANGSASSEQSCGLLNGTSLVPTRSHSMSSVSMLRQGVPYNFSPQHTQGTPVASFNTPSSSGGLSQTHQGAQVRSNNSLVVQTCDNSSAPSRQGSSPSLQPCSRPGQGGSETSVISTARLTPPGLRTPDGSGSAQQILCSHSADPIPGLFASGLSPDPSVAQLVSRSPEAEVKPAERKVSQESTASGRLPVNTLDIQETI